MRDWLTLLKEACAEGLEKQTACQLLGGVGSSLAVHAVRTTLQDPDALKVYDSDGIGSWAKL
eukprot:12911183-Prorocentrum_lima.AAC.1